MFLSHHNSLRSAFAWLLCCGLAAAQDAADDVRVIDNPTVRAVLDQPREAPDDYARAVFVLIDLDEPDLAAPIFDELIALGLGDDAKAALVEEFGSARFLRLARAGGTSSQAAAFAASCLAAAKARATNPQRLAALVERLGSDSPSAQAAALAGLQRAGRDGVAYCLDTIAKADRATQNQLREALVALSPLSRPALVAMLESSDAELRKQAAWALGKLNDRRATPLLAASAVLEPAGSEAGAAAQWAFKQITGQLADSATAARLLAGAAGDARRGVPPEKPDDSGRVTLYLGDPAAPTGLEPIWLSTDEAETVHAARLVRLQQRLNPSSERFRRRAMVLNLEVRSLFAGTGVSLPDDELLNPARAPLPLLDAALAEALKNKRFGAATAIAAAIGERGDTAALYTGGGRPSALVGALVAPHAAARFAALKSVFELDPQTPFPGSSRVLDTLLAFASGGGERLAVVATPNLERSATIVGHLAALGFEGLATNRGAEAVELAASADVEFALIDLAVLRPAVRETLFRLRRQPASGLTPIAVLAPDGRFGEARELAKDHERVVAFARPHSAESVAAIVEALQDEAPAGWPGAAERGAMAREARRWLAQLAAESDASFYHLHSRLGEVQAALATAPDAQSVGALARLGSSGSQLELLAIAGRGGSPIDARRDAAEAFRRSVDRFGVLLTTDQIQNQYDRYNASVGQSGNGADEETQEVLSRLLDAIESRRSRQQAEGSGQ